MDDLAIATAAAEKVIRDDIAAKVPGFYKHLIPDNVPHDLAAQIAAAVIHDLANAHAAPAKP